METVTFGIYWLEKAQNVISTLLTETSIELKFKNKRLFLAFSNRKNPVNFSEKSGKNDGKFFLRFYYLGLSVSVFFKMSKLQSSKSSKTSEATAVLQ